jgi:hypothetical protein
MLPYRNIQFVCDGDGVADKAYDGIPAGAVPDVGVPETAFPMAIR